MGRVHNKKQLLKKRQKIYLNSLMIRNLLARQNRNYIELAKSLGITTTYIWMMVDGARSPSPTMRRRIMREFPGNAWDELFILVKAENRG